LKVHKVSFDNYGYLLPKKNLALEPADPRDHSKLFIYNTEKDSVSFDHFYNLDKYLPSNSFLVLNNTKVLPARVTMKKLTGGKVFALFLVNEIKDDIIPVIVDRKITVGERIYFDENNFLVIIDQKENIFDLKISCLPAGRDFSRQKLFSVLKKYGTMPIPPYLKKTSLSRNDLIEKYQTIFAKREGSAAAPTASLHFTDRVFKKITNKDIKTYFITLHVGLGTFAPISEENIKEKKLHEEYFQVDEKTLQYIDTSKQKGNKLVAVGTTVTRTLESIETRDRKFFDGKPQTAKNLIPSFQKTDLFIFPPYDFKMVDILLTNFHLPKSSLMMLVEAFLQYKKAKKSLVELYNVAIKNNFRFYSFGDAMLIL
jgi:S-adenosylmethionine:tRNA ribosyltransferase-isomerase